MDHQPGGVGVADHRRGLQQPAVGGSRDQLVLAGSEPVGVLGDVTQPVRGDQVGVAARIACGDQVVRRPAAAGELGQAEVAAPVQLGEVGRLEALQVDRVPAVVAVGGQGGQQRLLQGEPDPVEVRRVLGLGVDPHGSARAGAGVPGQVEHLVERGHGVLAVVGGVAGAHAGDALDRAQGLELRKGEVLGEPTRERNPVHGPGGPPVGELGPGCDVGGATDLVLVPGDQDAVCGGDQVGLDVVRAPQDRLLVGGERVLGTGAAGAAVPDHERVVGTGRAGPAQVQHDHLGVVRGAGDPGVVAGVVVVVAHQDAAVPELDDHLDRDHREAEPVTDAVGARVGVRPDAVGVGDAEQVDHQLLLHEALRIGAAQVDLVEPLGDRGGAVEVVALDEQHPTVAHGEGVTDHVGGLVNLVLPGPPGVGPPPGVELVDVTTSLVGVVEVGPLHDRVEVATVGRGAHRLEPPAGRHPGLLVSEGGVLRRLAASEGDGCLEHGAVAAHVQQVGAELLPDPEGPVTGADQGLDVEVGAGEQPFTGVPADDRERDAVQRVPQGDEAAHLDATGATAGGLPAGADPIDAQQEVGRVGLGAEAVVRLRPEGAVGVLHHRGEAGDDLAGERAGAAVARGGQCSGRRPGGLEVRGQRGPGLQGGLQPGLDVPPVPRWGGGSRDRGRRGGGGDGGRGGGEKGETDQSVHPSAC